MHINPLDISTPATELNFSGKNVLIVDDYMEMRSILRDMLSSCGAEMKKIHMATNGNEAIAWLKRCRLTSCSAILSWVPERMASKCLKKQNINRLSGLLAFGS